MDKVGRVSSASVKKGTGKDWSQWIQILKKSGALSWTHREIVAFLKKKYKLTPWWQQGVTHGFEVATKRRIDGQSLKGDYSVTITKSVNASGPAAWKFMMSREGLQLWLSPMSELEIEMGAAFECEGGIYGEVRTVKAPRRLRLRWQETDWPKATWVQFSIVPRGFHKLKKSILVISHGSLTTTQQREAMRAHWKSKLAEAIEGMKS